MPHIAVWQGYCPEIPSQKRFPNFSVTLTDFDALLSMDCPEDSPRERA